MACPVILVSWWDAAFLVALVLLFGWTQVSPFARHWLVPILMALLVLVVIGATRGRSRK